MESRRVEAQDFSMLYGTIVVPRRMRALLRVRRRRDLLAAFRRIAAEEQLGLGIQEAAVAQLQEIAALLQPQRLDRDAERIAGFNRRRARDRAQVQKQARAEALRRTEEGSWCSQAEPAPDPAAEFPAALSGTEAVRQCMELAAAEVEQQASRGFYTTAIGRALAAAVHETRNGCGVHP